ncbi:MAG: alpha/beta fold hydrolase [Gammaproteobacteria bacterium]|nr:MAG: alpha/beta fold hydrolase [Gammaproteobacteria bacterium]UCH41272.1 MAG: alpha/beta fold hydrolase [Gammaproteobacteria bacterium]
MDHEIYHLENFGLQSGEVLPVAELAYKTYGKLGANGDNVVVLPTFYTGDHRRNEGFFGCGRAIDPARHFVVSVNLFGNGLSSSPSNTPAPFNAANFPRVTFYDNVRAQHALLTEKLGVEKVALVTGWSMAGCQSFQWGAQYPDMVEAILPFCGSAKTSEHNIVFLEGVKAALTADGTYADGNYTAAPVRGLKAFGRVYAGWAFSQTFYREHMYRLQGFDSAEALLQDWEQDHLNWDANDLLCKLWTWQRGDISAQPAYNYDFVAALNAIRAKTIIIACDNDLYFQPADNEIEIEHIRNGELRVYRSPWGHCVASPGNDPEFERYLDQAIYELID